MSKKKINFNEMAQKSGQTIHFTHVMTLKEVEFPAFLTEFSDSYDVTWGSETIFGRMDAVKPYQGTQRNISLAFDVLSPSLQHAKENFQKMTLLTQMMYPIYSDLLSKGNNTGRTIKGPPLLRLKFMNFIKNISGTEGEGLLGAINGFQFNPNKEAGFYVQDDNKTLYPKIFNISFKFDVLHEQTVGWHEDKFIMSNYPYGAAAYEKQEEAAGDTDADQKAADEADAMSSD